MLAWICGHWSEDWAACRQFITILVFPQPCFEIEEAVFSGYGTVSGHLVGQDSAQYSRR